MEFGMKGSTREREGDPLTSGKEKVRIISDRRCISKYARCF